VGWGRRFSTATRSYYRQLRGVSVAKPISTEVHMRFLCGSAYLNKHCGNKPNHSRNGQLLARTFVMDGRTDKTSISYIRLSLFHFRLQRSGSHILPCMSTAIVSRVSLDSKWLSQDILSNGNEVSLSTCSNCLPEYYSNTLRHITLQNLA